MGEFLTFNSFLSESYDETDDSIDPLESLEEILDDIKPKIEEYLEKCGLILDELEIDDEETFWVTYDPSSFNGALPNKISHYIQGLSDLISNEFMGTPVDWSFGQNARCTLAIFSLGNTKYTKFLRLRKGLKFA